MLRLHLPLRLPTPTPACHSFAPYITPNALPVLLVAGIAVATPAFSQATSSEKPAPRTNAESLSEHERQLLRAENLVPTTGAAAAYLPDGSCTLCHRRIAQSYRSLGMGRSFAPPGGNGWVEDFENNELYHPPSDRFYRISRDGGELTFRRWQHDEEGREINVFEHRVDWVLGSGTVARTYLYQTAGGELYQLPLAWYTQKKSWGMAPGFDRPEHDGVTRQVLRQCLFCHNAYPEIAAHSDRHHAPHLFPRELPHGIGCQRCHGPGARHVAAVLAGASPQEVASKIVNPARLPAPLQRDVCNQCHYQPSVAIFVIRRFERGDFSYRPGEAFADYAVRLEVDESRRPGEETFEINHHAHRLESSSCFLASEGGVHCLSCHDPHAKLTRPRLLSRSREVCRGCHQPGPELLAEHLSREACTVCHMPKRRAHDVVHAVMTDHRIRRGPPPEDWLAPRVELDPVLEDVRATDPTLEPRLAEVYEAVATLRAGSLQPTDWLRDRLPRVAADTTPWLDLARAQMRSQAWHDLAATVERLRDSSGHPLVFEWSGILELSRGRTGAARRILEQAVAVNPKRPEAHFNLARVIAMSGEPAAAIPGLEKAIELRENMMMAWLHLGGILVQLGRTEEAISALRRVPEIEPRFPHVYGELAEALRRAGRPEEAERYLRHGQHLAEHLAVQRRPPPP